MSHSMTCLPVFLSGSSNSAPPVEQAGLRRGRHLCRYGASCWPPQWEHPGRCQLWGWILVAVRIRPILPRHFQTCPAFQQRLYRSRAFVEDGKEHPQARRHRPLARHVMSWVPTDVHQECQTSFRTDVFWGMKVWVWNEQANSNPNDCSRCLHIVTANLFLPCAPAAQLRRFPILVHHVRIGTFTD